MRSEKHTKKNEVPTPSSLSRRGFLSALGMTTAGMIVQSCSKSKNPVAPALVKPTANISSTDRIGRSSEILARVATASIDNYDRTAVHNQMEALFTAIGGLGDIIPSGGKVGIKINCTGGNWSAIDYRNKSGLEPGESYWTHPEILRAVIELVKDSGAGQVTVVESIYDQESIDDFGYREVLEATGAGFVDLNYPDPYSDYLERAVGDGWLIYETLKQNALLSEFDCFISLPKSKLHKGGAVTHAMKNLVGTLPVPSGLYNAGASNRAAIHQHRKYDNNTSSNLRRVIVDLNLATRIHLAVNDAIWTVLGSEGPWNRDLVPTNFNTLIVSKDVVAADSISTQVIGFDPMAADNAKPFGGGINYLRLAQEKGLGIYDLNQIEVVDATVSTSVEKRPAAAA
ncbi:DUF362 domain-containing protein [bacterium]|nr:DUF362 domain-containing protein [bacterium]